MAHRRVHRGTVFRYQNEISEEPNLFSTACESHLT